MMDKRAGAPSLSVKNLHKSFGSYELLKGVSFDLYPGELVGLLGHNGAGKSTLIRCLMGSIISCRGEINYFGSPMKAGEHEALRKCGFLIEPAFYDFLSGGDNLKLLARAMWNRPQERIGDVLKLVGLTGAEKKKVGYYSYGMKQRLGLAQALLNKPDIIVLDEPTLGLDPEGVEDLKEILRRTAEESGAAVLFSSHQLEDVQDVCSRIMLLSGGRMKVDEPIGRIVGAVRFEIELEKEPEPNLRLLLNGEKQEAGSPKGETDAESPEEAGSEEDAGKEDEKDILLEGRHVSCRNREAFNRALRFIVSADAEIHSVNSAQNRLKDFFLQEKDQ